MITSGTTFAEALEEGRQALSDSPTSALDARLLLEEASGLSRADLIGADRDYIGETIAEAFLTLVNRRRKGEPVAYILGTQEFYGRDFAVGPGVLIPRPETEMLIDAAQGLHPQRILDLGTGSGCLLGTALKEAPNATGVGIDASAEALRYAERNLSALSVADRAELKLLRFEDAAFGLGQGLFDLILANPPYINPADELPVSVQDFEPNEALFAAEQGLAAHREIAQIMARFLTPTGSAFVEIGHDQGETAEEIFTRALPGRTVRTKKDLAGLPRMVAITPPSA